MWLKVGIPALVLLGLVTVRVVYYLFWRKHWDRRPGRAAKRGDTEVVVIRTPGEASVSGSPASGRVKDTPR